MNIWDLLGQVAPDELPLSRARVAAGIPATAAGPWDGALQVAADAKRVAELHRALTNRTP